MRSNAMLDVTFRHAAYIDDDMLYARQMSKVRWRQNIDDKSVATLPIMETVWRYVRSMYWRWHRVLAMQCFIVMWVLRRAKFKVYSQRQSNANECHNTANDGNSRTIWMLDATIVMLRVLTMTCYMLVKCQRQFIDDKSVATVPTMETVWQMCVCVLTMTLILGDEMLHGHVCFV